MKKRRSERGTLEPFLNWIDRKERVTLAQAVNFYMTRHPKEPITQAVVRGVLESLIRHEQEGVLVREGGDPGDAFYWRLP